MDCPKPFEIKLIASPEDYTPLGENSKIIGAFNPGVTSIETAGGGLETLLYLRVAESPIERDDGKIFLPYFNIKNKECSPLDIRYDVICRKDLKEIHKKDVLPKDRPSRLRHISLPRMMVLDEKRNIIERNMEPAIYPSWEYEKFGIEDVRITKFEDGRYFINYSTPHINFGVNTHILSTEDIKNPGNQKRVIFGNTPRSEIRGKDIGLFPNKVPSPCGTETIKKGDRIYASFARPNGFEGMCNPGIWVSYSPDLVHWGQEHRLILPKNNEVTGTGSPPVIRPYGFLEAYHETTMVNGRVKYVTKLMVLDSKNPWNVLSLSSTLLERKDFRDLLPEDGYVPNVVFTTGLIIDGERADFYSGIDDKWTIVTSFHTKDIDKFARKCA